MQRGKCNNDSELCAWNDERWAQVVPTVHIEMQPGAGQISCLQSHQLPLKFIISYISSTCGRMVGG